MDVCTGCGKNGCALVAGSGAFSTQHFCMYCWQKWEAEESKHQDIVPCSTCSAVARCQETPIGRDPLSGAYATRKLCAECWISWDSSTLANSSSRKIPDDLGTSSFQAGQWTAMLISLKSRSDRRCRVMALLKQHTWLVNELRWLQAIDGSRLAIEKLVPDLLSNNHSDSDKHNVPRFETLAETAITINNDWLHMTPGAMGCALSHRAIWEALVAEATDTRVTSPVPAWALVLEDDVLWVAPNLRQSLEEVLRLLPQGWHICYVGWHGNKVLQIAKGEPLDDCVPIQLERWHGHAEPMGTFAYLVSVEGARRLLANGCVFPLDYQLDAQLNYAFAAGSIRAYRCSDDSCLFWSAPCQFVDSDVQACWSADHMPALRAYKEAFLRRVQVLEQSNTCFPTFAHVIDASHVLSRLLNKAAIFRERCCVAYVFLDQQEASFRDIAVSRLFVSLRTLARKTSDICGTSMTRLVAIVVWYGADETFAQSVITDAKHIFPRIALCFQGSYVDALEGEWPGAGSLGMGNPVLAQWIALKPLLALCIDHAIVAYPHVAFGEAGIELFSSVCHETTHVALSQSLGVDNEFEVSDIAVEDVFGQVCSNPLASYVVGQNVRLPPPIGAHAVLYRHRAWARMATWVRELLRIFMRLCEASGVVVCDIAAAAALRYTGVPLVVSAEIGASQRVFADIAARCILALSKLQVSPCRMQGLLAYEHLKEILEWECCD